MLGPLEEAGEVTYRLHLEGAPLGPEIVRETFQRACAAWSEAGPVSFREARADETPVLTVSFGLASHGPCPPFGIDTSVAHTTTIDGRPAIHVDRDRTWKPDGLREGRDTPLYQTFLHELGHVLGIGHTTDESALMAPDPRTERIEPSDRDALLTLYGGEPAGPDDLRVVRGDETTAVLHGLRVEGAIGAGCFDTDGDGRDEVLVWRTDREGAGQLTSFRFERDGRVSRTVGPNFGIVDGSARVALGTGPSGERLLILTYPDGTRIARVFGPDGVPVTFEGPLPEAYEPPEPRLEADIDGDGSRESRLL